MPAPASEGALAMAGSGVSACARALAAKLEELLNIWQKNAPLGKHLPGLPIYGALGAHLGDFLIYASANGPPLGSVSAQLLVQALTERGLQVNVVGSQDATYGDSLANLPGRTLVPPPGFYVLPPGRVVPKIIRQRYEFTPGRGVVRRA
eukprot:8953476-Alexandrium_andersonii.AAC.1